MKTFVLIAAAALLCAAPARAQDVTGVWQGTLDIFGTNMRLTLHVAQDDKGALSGTLDSPDMGARGIEVSSFKLKKTSVKFELPTYNGSFEGKIAEDGQTIAGSWYVGEMSLPITFKRRESSAPAAAKPVSAKPFQPGVDPKTTAVPVHPKTPVVEDVWLGTYQTPGGMKLKMQLHVSHDASGALVVKMDSLNEGVNGIRTSNAYQRDTAIHFEIPTAEIIYDGTLNAAKDEMSGTFSRSGGTQPLSFKLFGAAPHETQAPQNPPPAAAPASATGIEGMWMGTILASGDIKLRILLHVERDANGALSAKMDSLDQGATGIAIPIVSLNDSAFHFQIPAGGITYDGTLNSTKDVITGTFTQGSIAQPLNFKHFQQLPPAPKRPQDPVKPYPYIEEDVSYVNPKAPQVTLAGTLTLPRGAGPFPVAILICGSGPHDRDEALLGHRPFLVISDYLTRHGIAVLRYDKRGVAKSTGNYAQASTSDFATDAEAGITYLKTRKEINPHRIGLIGHSEGGAIAPMVASRNSDVAWIVMLAGQGLRGDQILYLQQSLIATASGVKEQDVAKAYALNSKLYAATAAETNPANLSADLEAVLAADEDGRKMSPAQRAAAIQQLSSPWLREFLVYDPIPALQNTKCPVLALNGEHDLQVPPTQDLPAIRKALQDGGNKDFQVTEIPGLNHLFQHSATGVPSEYGSIEETFSPEVLELMTNWVRKHSGM
jgi:pimeloyl-ACP methyl ester carboxylesterase